MSKFIDIVGKTYGRLTVVSHAGIQRHKKSLFHMWNCSCECGGTTVVRGGNLKAGLTRSCGCLRSQKSRAKLTAYNAPLDAPACLAPLRDLVAQYPDRNGVTLAGWSDLHDLCAYVDALERKIASRRGAAL